MINKSGSHFALDYTRKSNSLISHSQYSNFFHKCEYTVTICRYIKTYLYCDTVRGPVFYDQFSGTILNVLDVHLFSK